MEQASSLPEALQVAYTYMLAAGLATARVMGMMVIAPAFSRIGLTGFVRGGVALALALPVVPVLLDMLNQQHTVSLGMMTGLFLKETVVGMVVGAVFGIPFWAAEAAGDILDLQRGSTSGTLIDPSQSNETSITGTLLTLVMLAMFFTAGGMNMMVGGLYQSYALWPPGQFLPMFDANAGVLLLQMLDTVMRVGLMVAAPVVIILLLTDLSMAFMTRAAEQLHIFDLSLAAKNLVFAIVMVLYSFYLLEHQTGLLATLLNANSAMDAFAPNTR